MTGFVKQNMWQPSSIWMTKGRVFNQEFASKGRGQQQRAEVDSPAWLGWDGWVNFSQKNIDNH